MSEREIFSAAVSLTDPAGREVFLRQACAGRDNLRRRVDALLRAHDEASAFLGTPAIEQALGTTAPNVSGTPPQVGENFFEVYNGSPSVANHGDHIVSAPRTASCNP
jgi:hypothetical protein